MKSTTMASSGHDKEHSSQQNRQIHNNRARGQLPRAVETVIFMGCPYDLAISTYQRLQREADDRPSRNDDSTPREPDTSGNTSHDVTAIALYLAVEDTFHHSDSAHVGVASGAGISVSGSEGSSTSSGRDVDDETASPGMLTLAATSNIAQTADPSTQSETTTVSATNETVCSQQRPANVTTAETSNQSSGEPPTQRSEAEAEALGENTSSDRTGESTTSEDQTRRKRRLLERLRMLRAENKRLLARNICHHCKQRPVTLTLLPCGHYCYCEECGKSFESCPLCRRTILADVKTFLS